MKCLASGEVLGPEPDLIQHMPALPHDEVTPAITTVRGEGEGKSRATAAVKLACDCQALSAPCIESTR